MSAARRRRLASACAALALAAPAGCSLFQREARLVRTLPTSESILSQASYVARVRVSSRVPIEAAYKRGSLSCGWYYQAQVLELLKGDAADALDFFTEQALEVASEYLVAVRDTSVRGPQLDPSTEWDTQRRLRCRVAYERIATGVARVEAGEDGLTVEDARMLPEPIRRQAARGAVPWPVVQRELFAAATPGPEPALVEGPRAPEPAPQQLAEPEAPPQRATEPEAPAPAASEPAPERAAEASPAPAPEGAPEPAPAPAKKNRWLPWNWEFEWL